jgi:hypothetical protein
MNIIFFVNKYFLYRFQITIIEETRKRFPDAIIYLSIIRNAPFKYKWRKKSLLNIIDRRFSNFTYYPLDQAVFKTVQSVNPNIILLNDFDNRQELFSIDWAIYLYPEPEVSLFQSLNIRNLCKFSFEEKYWFHNSLTKHDHTYIKLLKFNTVNKEWERFNILRFSTQTGILNNRSKALFYFSILLVKALGNEFNDEIDFKNSIFQIIKRNKYIDILKYYFTLLRLILSRKINRKRLNWKIALKLNNKLFFLKQPERTFWADPFIIKRDKLFIFIEDYNYETNLGEIALLEMSNEFEVEKKTSIIKENFHLSFPNVFKIGEEYFMMPETSSKSSVCIYKSDNFPYEWSMHTEIMSGIKLIDAVWVFHNGYYWLFANKIHEFESENNECLYVFYSRDLFSRNWISHPLNPVVVDSGKSRNAGQIVEEDGKLFRFSQNCNDAYGASIVVNEIIELSPLFYSETSESFINPERPYLGVHTYNKSGDLEVLDFLIEE